MILFDFHKNKTVFTNGKTVLFDEYARLFSFKAIATSAAFRIAITRIAYVDFAKGAIIASAVVFTFRNAATDRSVYVHTFFIHHHKNPP